MQKLSNRAAEGRLLSGMSAELERAFVEFFDGFARLPEGTVLVLAARRAFCLYRSLLRAGVIEPGTRSLGVNTYSHRAIDNGIPKEWNSVVFADDIANSGLTLARVRARFEEQDRVFDFRLFGRSQLMPEDPDVRDACLLQSPLSHPELARFSAAAAAFISDVGEPYFVDFPIYDVLGVESPSQFVVPRDWNAYRLGVRRGIPSETLSITVIPPHEFAEDFAVWVGLEAPLLQLVKLRYYRSEIRGECQVRVMPKVVLGDVPMRSLGSALECLGIDRSTIGEWSAETAYRFANTLVSSRVIEFCKLRALPGWLRSARLHLERDHLAANTTPHCGSILRKHIEHVVDLGAHTKDQEPVNAREWSCELRSPDPDLARTVGLSMYEHWASEVNNPNFATDSGSQLRRALTFAELVGDNASDAHTFADQAAVVDLLNDRGIVVPAVRKLTNDGSVVGKRYRGGEGTPSLRLLYGLFAAARKIAGSFADQVYLTFGSSADPGLSDLGLPDPSELDRVDVRLPDPALHQQAETFGRESEGYDLAGAMAILKQSFEGGPSVEPDQGAYTLVSELGTAARNLAEWTAIPNANHDLPKLNEVQLIDIDRHCRALVSLWQAQTSSAQRPKFVRQALETHRRGLMRWAVLAPSGPKESFGPQEALRWPARSAEPSSPEGIVLRVFRRHRLPDTLALAWWQSPEEALEGQAPAEYAAGWSKAALERLARSWATRLTY